MKKLCGLMVLLLCVVFCACSKADITTDKMSGAGGEAAQIGDTSRKIIHTYSCDLTTGDISATVKIINEALAEFEESYVEQSEINSDSAFLVLRVRAEDYAALVACIPDAGKVVNAKSSAQDITDSYIGLETKKTSIENQLKRLNELYDKASIYEMASISSQIRSVEQELFQILAQLQNYDSLVSLSSVRINISLEGATSAEKTLNKAISKVWRGVYYALLVVVIILPFGSVAAGIFVLTYCLTKKRRAKAQALVIKSKEVNTGGRSGDADNGGGNGNSNDGNNINDGNR